LITIGLKSNVSPAAHPLNTTTISIGIG
jgi:hypothetical protein